jgi:hypothetical protein
MEEQVSDRITTESAKSILRVMLANAVARTVVGTIATLQEMEAPLTEIQQVGIVATAMMDYRTTADEAEESVDAEVVMDGLRTMTARGRVEWATEDEVRKAWDTRTEEM